MDSGRLRNGGAKIRNSQTLAPKKKPFLKARSIVHMHAGGGAGAGAPRPLELQLRDEAVGDGHDALQHGHAM